MKWLRYILLYTPVVLISTLGFLYYGFRFQGIEFTGLKETLSAEAIKPLLEVYRLANTGIVPALFVTLILLLAKHGGPGKVFVVHIEHYLIYFIAPKLLDHIVTVYNVTAGSSKFYTAYDMHEICIWLMIVWAIHTPIRIVILKRKMRYNGL